MNWIEGLDKRRGLFIGAVLIISLVSLLIASLRNPQSYDAFWHLQMGKDWIVNGISPWIDHYSFTYNGQPISNPPVVFEVLLHFSVSTFGLRTGFIMIKAFAYLMIIGAALVALREWKAPAILYAVVVPVIVFLLQLRSLVRPELFSYAFSIVALILYYRARNEISARHLIPMVALMLLWTNYHSSVVGYVIFFGFFLDCAISQINTRAKFRSWVQWLLWGLVIFAVGFLNHDFSHPLIEALLFPPEWKSLILEYLPPAPHVKSLVGIYAVMVVALITPVLALQQRKMGILVIWTVLAYQSVMMQRMLTPSGIVITMMAAHLLINSGLAGKNWFDGSRFAKLTGGACLLLIGMALYSNVERSVHFLNENKTALSRYPEALADYMRREQVHGRIFNDYGIGGYLIYRLSPDSQVYIDGRTQILYPLEHMRQFKNSQKSPEALRHELDKYDVDLIVMSYSQHAHDQVAQLGNFGLDFIDSYVALYRRDAGNFQNLGRLMSMPACWRPEMITPLDVERQRASQILPANSELVPFADFVLGLARATDKKAFMDNSFDESDWSDDIRRFAAYRFLELGEFDVARILLGNTEAERPEDYLVASLAMILAENYDLAATILDDYAVKQSIGIKPQYYVIALQLYQAISEHQPLSLVEQRYSRELSSTIKERGVPVSDADLNLARFCL